ncbi:DinB family protein [Chitinophagaceae bacterium MMS25-I14]
MTNSIASSALIFKMNDRLFLNALEGVTEEQAAERLSGHNNPIVWIAAHTVWARYNALAFLGKPADNPFRGMFESFKPYSITEKYPSLETVRAEWQKVSSLLKNALDDASEDQLVADSPLKSPIGDFSNGGTIVFFAQHESYDIGQLGYLKKYYTGEAMKYN